MNKTEIAAKYIELRDKLIAERNIDGFWTGRLSSSALSTAVAIVALKLADKDADRERITGGVNWLFLNINTDGGYGDTPESVSNVSTTLLCYAAVRLCQTGGNGSSTLKAMENWLASEGISLDSETVTASILKLYGNDYTFSLPILSMLAICGAISFASLNRIPRLPFELTLLPSLFYRFLNLHVVSYALPALIGVGVFLHRNRKKGILTRGIIRNSLIKPAIEKLNRLVPDSGGFLEAIPLTGFVAICLMASGEEGNITVLRCLGFLRNQQREDSSWPIDTDLSTWITTLSIKALGADLKLAIAQNQIDLLRKHLINLQYKTIHPFNHAKPGGWGWTSYSGSVPDADDTPGALLALLELYSGTKEELSAIENGCNWLTDIQNNDGGFPTFCKGWGKLPFDKSCADLTGHALLAMLKTTEKLYKEVSPGILKKIEKSIHRAADYLAKYQSDDGAWLPLWFGNQFTGDKTNPVYGTAKVSIYLLECLTFRNPEPGLTEKLARMAQKAQTYLLNQQNDDGSWGGKAGVSGTIEETSLAVSALAQKIDEVCIKAVMWLERQEVIKSSPIGLYFALLWYDERMYPLIYYTEALRRLSNSINRGQN